MTAIDDDLIVSKETFGNFASDVIVQDDDGNEYTLVVIKNPQKKEK